MGLFDFIFGKQNKVVGGGYFDTFTAYAPVFSSWNGQLYESELVRSAIDARARHISKLNIEITGSAKPTLRSNMKQGPNEFMTWAQFMYRLSTILDMQNTAFIVPVLGPNGETTGIYPVLPSRCEMVDVNGKPWVRYTFANGKTAAIPFKECAVMTKFQYSKDFYGENNSALGETLSLINVQNQGIEEAITNSASYRFMAQVNNFSRAEDLAKERQRFSKENLASDAKGGGLLLFPNTYTNIQQIKSTPYTIDSAQRELIQRNVYNYFGVNEDILQNKAMGDQWNAFYEGCIEPFSIQFSEVVSKMLFTARERAQGAAVTAIANRLQYMSNKDKLNLAQQMADRGIMTRNEVRALWNLPPVEGGDVATIRGEYYMIDDKGNMITKEDNTANDSSVNEGDDNE